MGAAMKKTAIYYRVSTDAQTNENQELDLANWVEANAPDALTFQDSFTGKTMDRPGWGELWQMIERREIDRIVVWRLDRLGRTARGLTALFDELVSRNVALFSYKDGLDLSTPAGRLMANVLASVAQFETEVRGERVKAGLERAKANGKRWGGMRGKRLLVRAWTKRQVEMVKKFSEPPFQFCPAELARWVKLPDSSVRRMLKERPWERNDLIYREKVKEPRLRHSARTHAVHVDA